MATQTAAHVTTKPKSRWRKSLFQFEFVAGAILTGVIFALVLFSGWIYPGGGETIDLQARLTPPFQSSQHIFGTDPLGRDLLERIIIGGRISYAVGVLSAIGAVVFGTVIGLVAGYYRGIWDIFLSLIHI